VLHDTSRLDLRHTPLAGCVLHAVDGNERHYDLPELPSHRLAQPDDIAAAARLPSRAAGLRSGRSAESLCFGQLARR
jgi:hypothetical protein